MLDSLLQAAEALLRLSTGRLSRQFLTLARYRPLNPFRAACLDSSTFEFRYQEREQVYNDFAHFAQIFDKSPNTKRLVVQALMKQHGCRLGHGELIPGSARGNGGASGLGP